MARLWKESLELIYLKIKRQISLKHRLAWNNNKRLGILVTIVFIYVACNYHMKGNHINCVYIFFLFNGAYSLGVLPQFIVAHVIH